MTENKTKKLALSILFDAIGMLSYIFPPFTEIIDIAWAPLAGWLMTKMYEGKVGKAAGFFTLIEEGFPGLDFIPTFTLMWIYTYVVKKEKVQGDVIEVDPS